MTSVGDDKGAKPPMDKKLTDKPFCEKALPKREVGDNLIFLIKLAGCLLVIEIVLLLVGWKQ